MGYFRTSLGGSTDFADLKVALQTYANQYGVSIPDIGSEVNVGPLTTQAVQAVFRDALSRFSSQLASSGETAHIQAVAQATTAQIIANAALFAGYANGFLISSVALPSNRPSSSPSLNARTQAKTASASSAIPLLLGVGALALLALKKR